jgi:hypothetical protein
MIQLYSYICDRMTLYYKLCATDHRIVKAPNKAGVKTNKVMSGYCFALARLLVIS